MSLRISKKVNSSISKTENHWKVKMVSATKELHIINVQQWVRGLAYGNLG